MKTITTKNIRYKLSTSKLLVTGTLLLQLFFYLFAQSVTAQPTLIKDINSLPQGLDKFASTIGVIGFEQTLIIGNTLYFSMFTEGKGLELWKSDGTSIGTTLVKDIRPGALSSNPESFTNVNGILFFVADDGVSGREIWKSDGTEAGTVLVKDIYIGSNNGIDTFFTNFVEFNNKLYFTANDGVIPSQQIWSSDGTSVGTVKLTTTFTSISQFTRVSNAFFFVGNTPTFGNELRFFNGTNILTYDFVIGPSSSNPNILIGLQNSVLVDAFDNGIYNINTSNATLLRIFDNGAFNSNYFRVTKSNGIVYFFGKDNQIGDGLWKTDGTASGTTFIKSLLYKPFLGQNIGLNGKFIFTGNDDYYWASDGTFAGTFPLTNFAYSSSTSGGSESSPVEYNGNIYFIGRSPAFGNSLWKTDGTVGGTSLAIDMIPSVNPNEGVIQKLAGNLNGRLAFFSYLEYSAFAIPKPHGLFTTDGTQLGTQYVWGNRLSSDESNYVDQYNKVSLNGKVYFAADDGVHGTELWKTDFTPSGTEMIRDLTLGAKGGVQEIIDFNGKMYFSNYDYSSSKTQLWQTDGSLIGTTFIKDFLSLGNFRLFNNQLLFVAEDGVTGSELWKTDGTLVGTVQVKDIYPGSNSSGIHTDYWTIFNNTLFFSADDGTNGKELWKSDGTSSGTVLVKNINGSAGSSIGNFLAVGTSLCFSANDGVNGSELWKTDGTSSGTALVKDVNIGSLDSDLELGEESAGGFAFFVATTALNGKELWRTDGTASGTSLIKDVNPGVGTGLVTNDQFRSAFQVNNTLYFSGTDGTNGYELWKSDGTAQGTVLVKDINSGVASSNPVFIGKTNDGKVLFYAIDPTNGNELWVSNGTESGTSLVKDISAGSAGSFTDDRSLQVGNKVLFVADGDGKGKELWETDGTTGGTLLTGDINPGSLSSNPQFLKLFQTNKAIFSATNQITGNELYVYEVQINVTSLTPPIALAASSITASGFTANWSTASGATGYRLDVSADNFATFVAGFSDKTVTTLSDVVTGLTAATAYKYRVRAVNANGTSANSNVSDVTTSAAGTPPAIPVASAATTISTTGFTANWNAVAGATGYQLDISADNFSTFIAGYNSKLITGLTETAIGLTASTSYKYRVRAVNAVGTSANSNEITATTLALPAAPIAAAATSITASGFTANWNAVSGATGYRLDVSADNFATFVAGFSDKTVTTLSDVVTGLTAATAYKYRVRAVNANGTSANSNVSDVTTSAAGTPPAIPVASAATTISTIGFTANWNVVSGATGYQLDISGDNFATFVAGYNSKSVTATTEAVTGLTASTTYKYRVRATNASGTSANSNVIDVTTTASSSKQNQTITFAAIANKTLGDAPFIIGATASSGLAVTYATTSDKITIANGVTTLVKAGRTVITASQAGDANFNAAPSVDQSFCIRPAKPTITPGGQNTETITLASSATAGNQWFKDGVAITGATATTLAVTTLNVGVYKVQTKADDCISEFSTDFPIIVTGDLPTAQTGISVSPNPVEEVLEIRGIIGEVKNYEIFDLAGRGAKIALEKQKDSYFAPVRHLSQGMYVLRVQAGDQILQVKFVKK